MINFERNSFSKKRKFPLFIIIIIMDEIMQKPPRWDFRTAGGKGEPSPQFQLAGLREFIIFLDT